MKYKYTTIFFRKKEQKRNSDDLGLRSRHHSQNLSGNKKSSSSIVVRVSNQTTGTEPVRSLNKYRETPAKIEAATFGVLN